MPLQSTHRRKFFRPDISHSLRWPLLISISGVTLLILVVLGVWIYAFTSRAEQDIWRSRQEEATRNTAKAVENLLQARQSELSLIAALDPGVLNSPSQPLKTFLQQNQAWLAVQRLDTSGRQIAAASLSEEQPFGQQADITSEWFSAARSGSLFVGDPQASPSGSHYLILSLPTFDGGIVTGQANLELLWDVFHQFRFGDTGQAYLLDLSTGQVVAAPQDSLLHPGGYIGEHSVFQQIPTTNGYQWSGIYTNSRGTRVIGQSLPVAGTRWVLITELAQSESMTLRLFALAVFGAGLLALWGLTTIILHRFLTRMVLLPLQNLGEGAERIGRGDLQYRVPVSRPDEIGRVATAFNDMASNLAEENQRTQTAYQHAIEANRFKSEILNNVSHELRTPLGVILGFAEMLKEGLYGPVTEEQSQPLENIIKSAGVLTQLINDLIDQAKLDSHQVRLKKATFRPEDVLRPVATRMIVMAQNKGLEFEASLSPDLPQEMVGDAARLRQILTNLSSNAVKFTQTGKIAIHIYQPGPDHWGMQVQDTGCGIPPEKQDAIFEPFRQADGSETREVNGAGLGLSIVRQLVELMNGKILLDSEVGVGSTFTVLFPILKAPLPE